MSELYQHRARKRFRPELPARCRGDSPHPPCHPCPRGSAPAGDRPGPGALTEGLLGSGAPGRDRARPGPDPLLKLKFGLESRFSLHQGDALKFDFASLVERREAASGWQPALQHLHATDLPSAGVRAGDRDMHFMLRKEVVERLAATPGGGDWGRLSIMVSITVGWSTCSTSAPARSTRRPRSTRPSSVSPLRRAAPSGTRSETARAGGPRGLQPTPQDPAQYPQTSPERRGHRGRRGRSDPPSRTTRPGRIRPPGQPAGRAARQSLVW